MQQSSFTLTSLFLTATLCLLFLIPGQTQAQVSYMQSVGGSYMLGVVNNSGSSDVVGVPALTFNPRLNLELSPEMSFSATSYPSIGAVGFFNSRSGGNGTIGFDLPVLAQFNFGQHATPDSETPVGAYAAAGWGFALVAGGDQVFGSYGGALLGPTAEFGIKFLVMEQSVGVRAKYMNDVLQDDSSHLFMVSLLYNLQPK